jgi:hypothetical protein
MKVPGPAVLQKMLSKASNGSKQAPIPVGDTTPKSILVFFLPSLFCFCDYFLIFLERGMYHLIFVSLVHRGSRIGKASYLRKLMQFTTGRFIRNLIMSRILRKLEFPARMSLQKLLSV